MRVSIVVPAFNEERLLGATLACITAATSAFARRGWESELIVCDNNSTDRTAEVARQAGATVVFEPVNQISRSRNRAAAAASGDWLIFVDADSHPGAELFDDVATQIESGNCLAGGSTMILDEHFPIGSLITHIWNGASRVFRLLAGSFIFCDTAVFRSIGGFSEELFASEELELTARLKEVARARKKQLVILHGHPLVTSGRKIHLYSVREHLWFLTKTVLGFGSTLKSRAACHTWYDGRR